MTELQELEYELLNRVLGNLFTIIEKAEESSEEMERELGKRLPRLPKGIADEMLQIVYQTIDTGRAICGRLNELNEDYCISDGRYGTNGCSYNLRLASKAKSAGINYVALDRLNYRDIEDAIRYIEKKGLARIAENI